MAPFGSAERSRINVQGCLKHLCVVTFLRFTESPMCSFTLPDICTFSGEKRRFVDRVAGGGGGQTVSFRLQARNSMVTACQRSCGKVMFSVVSVIM